MIIELFAINLALLDTIVIYFIAGPKIEKFIGRKVLKCPPQ